LEEHDPCPEHPLGQYAEVATAKERMRATFNIIVENTTRVSEKKMSV
jgi:hypothetical protein